MDTAYLCLKRDIQSEWCLNIPGDVETRVLSRLHGLSAITQGQRGCREGGRGRGVVSCTRLTELFHIPDVRIYNCDNWMN